MKNQIKKFGGMQRLLFLFACSLLLPLTSFAQSAQTHNCSLVFEEDYTVENLGYHVIEVELKSAGQLRVNLKADGKIDFYFMTEADYQKWRKNKRNFSTLIHHEKTTGFTNAIAQVTPGDYAAILLNTRSLIDDKNVDVRMEICTP